MFTKPQESNSPDNNGGHGNTFVWTPTFLTVRKVTVHRKAARKVTVRKVAVHRKAARKVAMRKVGVHRKAARKVAMRKVAVHRKVVSKVSVHRKVLPSPPLLSGLLLSRSFEHFSHFILEFISLL